MKLASAVKAFIVKGDDFLLLRKSSSEDVTPNAFDLPGGRRKTGEDPASALVREVLEETGAEIRIVTPIDIWVYPVPKQDLELIGVTYLCRFKKGKIKLSDEHVSAVWSDRRARAVFPAWLNRTIKAAKNK